MPEDRKSWGGRRVYTSGVNCVHFHRNSCVFSSALLRPLQPPGHCGPVSCCNSWRGREAGGESPELEHRPEVVNGYFSLRLFGRWWGCWSPHEGALSLCVHGVGPECHGGLRSHPRKPSGFLESHACRGRRPRSRPGDFPQPRWPGLPGETCPRSVPGAHPLLVISPSMWHLGLFPCL